MSLRTAAIATAWKVANARVRVVVETRVTSAQVLGSLSVAGFACLTRRLRVQTHGKDLVAVANLQLQHTVTPTNYSTALYQLRYACSAGLARTSTKVTAGAAVITGDLEVVANHVAAVAPPTKRTGHRDAKHAKTYGIFVA